MHRGKLPNDPHYISGMIGITVKKWNSISDFLVQKGKISRENHFISNFRATFEVEKLAVFSGKQAKNATGSNKNKDLTKAKPKPKSSHCALKPEPEPEEERSLFAKANRKNPELVSVPKKKQGPEQFEKWWNECYPHPHNRKQNRAGAFKKYSAVLRSGVSEDDLLAAARAYGPYCAKVSKQPRLPLVWLNQSGWADAETSKTHSADEIAEAARTRNAEAIKKQQDYLTQNISPSDAREMIRLGLVSEAECDAAKINY